MKRTKSLKRNKPLQSKTPFRSNSTLKSKSHLKSNSTLKQKKPMSKKRSAKARAKDFTQETKGIVFERADGMCEICKMKPIAHFHHVIFRSHGGTNELSNVCGVCIECHNLCHSSRKMREYAVDLAKKLSHGVD